MDDGLSESKPERGTFQPPRGTRDFFPPQMALRNWLTDGWKSVSRRHGFEEYDGPIFEHLDLYTVKSGEEIVSQLFNFEDRGGRRLAIRPEITPTLARMVAAKAASLPRPIKWFSVPRLCRAERPQRGRLREFFQWNIDVIGAEGVLADAECVFVALDFLRQAGLGPQTIELRVNSRTIIAALLEQGGLEPARHDRVFAVMDKFDKLAPDAFRAYALEQGLSESDLGRVQEILAVADLDQMASLVRTEVARAEFDRLKELADLLAAFGVGDYFTYRPAVVRGLAYYTGIVFEVFDRASRLRAVAGGGRYDRLIKLFGGPDLPAVGFGMGDVVLGELLQEQGKLPADLGRSRLDFFVIEAAGDLFADAVSVCGRLRAAGYAAELSYKRQGLSKQLKQAASRAGAAVIVGAETRERGVVTVKNLADGSQREVPLESLLARPAP